MLPTSVPASSMSRSMFIVSSEPTRATCNASANTRVAGAIGGEEAVVWILRRRDKVIVPWDNPARSMLLLGNGGRRPDIFDVFEHENRFFGCTLELLEE